MAATKNELERVLRAKEAADFLGELAKPVQDKDRDLAEPRDILQSYFADKLSSPGVPGCCVQRGSSAATMLDSASRSASPVKRKVTSPYTRRNTTDWLLRSFPYGACRVQHIQSEIAQLESLPWRTSRYVCLADVAVPCRNGL